MNEDQIQKLRGETVEEIKGQLPAMTPGELRDLLAAEKGDASPRKTLVAAIEDELHDREVEDAKEFFADASDEKLADGVRYARESGNRKLLTLLQGEIDNRAAVKNNGSGEGTDRAAEGSAAPAPKWQAEDYTGPLTADQAQWRLHHIKPAGVITK